MAIVLLSSAAFLLDDADPVVAAANTTQFSQTIRLSPLGDVRVKALPVGAVWEASDDDLPVLARQVRHFHLDAGMALQVRRDGADDVKVWANRVGGSPQDLQSGSGAENGSGAEVPSTPEGAVAGDRYIIEATADGWKISSAPTGFALPEGGEVGQTLVQAVGGGYAWMDFPADIDEVPDEGTPGWFLTKTSDGVAWAAIDLSALEARVDQLEDDMSSLSGYVGGINDAVTQNTADIGIIYTDLGVQTGRIDALEAAPGYDDTALAGRVTTLEDDVATPFIGEPAVADTSSQLVGNTAIPDPTAMIGFNFSYGSEIALPHIIDADTERDAAGLVDLMNAHIQENYPVALRGIVVSQNAGVLSVTAPGILPLKVFHGWAELGFDEAQTNTGTVGTVGTGTNDRLSAAESRVADHARQLNAARRLPGNATAEWYPTTDFTYDFTNGGLFDGTLAFNIALYGLSNTLIEITYVDALAGAADPAAVTAFELMTLLNAKFSAEGVNAYMGLESQGAVWIFKTYSGLGGSGAEMQITALAEDLGGTSPGIGGADGYYVGTDSAEAGARLDAVEETLGVNPVFTKEVVDIPGTAATILGDAYTNLDFTSGGSNDGAISFNVWVDGGAPQFVEVNWALANANVADPSSVTISEFIALIVPQVSGIAIVDDGGAIRFTADTGIVGTDSTLEITGLTLSGDFPPVGSGISNASEQGTAALTNTLSMTAGQAIQYLLNNS